MIILDTHIWLWWLSENNQLSDGELTALDRLALQSALYISWVNVWELEILERKGKIALEGGFEQWVSTKLDTPGFNVLPVTVEVILAQRQLPDSFHADPADRLITATSIQYGYPLATKDQKIIDSGACEIWEA